MGPYGTLCGPTEDLQDCFGPKDLWPYRGSSKMGGIGSRCGSLGSYFVRREPRPPGSLWNASGPLKRPKNPKNAKNGPPWAPPWGGPGGPPIAPRGAGAVGEHLRCILHWFMRGHCRPSRPLDRQVLWALRPIALVSTELPNPVSSSPAAQDSNHRPYQCKLHRRCSPTAPAPLGQIGGPPGPPQGGPRGAHFWHFLGFLAVLGVRRHSRGFLEAVAPSSRSMSPNCHTWT